MSDNYLSRNYYPPLRVDSSVPDEVIRQSWEDLIREADEIFGKIEDNGVFKTVYFNGPEEIDLDSNEDLWAFLKRLEREGFLMIFKDDRFRGGWLVDGLCTSPRETYQLNQMYKVTYLDNNEKCIRADEEEEDIDDRPITYHFDKVKPAVEPTIETPVETPDEPTIEPTIETKAEVPKKHKKKSWFSRFFRSKK
jgi:hypothetical protein